MTSIKISKKLKNALLDGTLMPHKNPIERVGEDGNFKLHYSSATFTLNEDMTVTVTWNYKDLPVAYIKHDMALRPGDSLTIEQMRGYHFAEMSL